MDSYAAPRHYVGKPGLRAQPTTSKPAMDDDKNNSRPPRCA
jgi:hypothetical protein